MGKTSKRRVILNEQIEENYPKVFIT